MKAVVLAAGEGSRIWPLAETKPKHLLPIAGKPILGHVLTALAEGGISDATIVVGFHEEAIQQALGDGAEYKIRLTYLRQPRWTGTASALRIAYDAVGRERFLVVYGDLVITPNAVNAVIGKSRDCSRVIGVVRVPDASQYGVVESDEDNVTKIVEKPGSMTGKPGWVNTGMYVLDREVFEAIDATGQSRRAEYELTSSLQLLVRRGKEIKSAVVEPSDWLDVGRPWDLLVANKRILSRLREKMLGTIESGVTLKGPVSVDEDAVIKSGTYVEGPVYCGKGTRIGPNARVRPFTSLENDVLVGPFCDIKNTIVMRGSKIPHLSYVGDSVIGEACNLGAGTVTANVRFDKRTVRMKIKGQLSDSGQEKLGVIMGDRVQTGINVSLMPGVRIGAESWIGPGAIVSKDVPSGRTLLVKQSYEVRIRSSKKTKRAA